MINKGFLIGYKQMFRLFLLCKVKKTAVSGLTSLTADDLA